MQLALTQCTGTLTPKSGSMYQSTMRTAAKIRRAGVSRTPSTARDSRSFLPYTHARTHITHSLGSLKPVTYLHISLIRARRQKKVNAKSGRHKNDVALYGRSAYIDYLLFLFSSHRRTAGICSWLYVDLALYLFFSLSLASLPPSHPPSFIQPSIPLPLT